MSMSEVFESDASISEGTGCMRANMPVFLFPRGPKPFGVLQGGARVSMLAVFVALMSGVRAASDQG
jgi:hypothetical protein